METDPNEGNHKGDTPLHAAARLGFKLIINVLLAGGANMNLSNHARKTPAQVAIDAETGKLISDYTVRSLSRASSNSNPLSRKASGEPNSAKTPLSQAFNEPDGVRSKSPALPLSRKASGGSV